MASAKNDYDDHVDDIISKLDLANMKPVDEVEIDVGNDDDTTSSIGLTVSDTSSKKPGSLVDNLKKLLPNKNADVSGNGASSGSAVTAGNSAGSHHRDSHRNSKSSERWKVLKEVKVDKLPQGFVCKYVGSKPCTGLWGVRHTRQPVDQLVTELRRLPEGEDLPLVNVKLSGEGLKATLHMHNKSTRPLPDSGLLPLQFISYAVQDPRYNRIFVFILVREMSSRERKTECHAYLCASDVVARKMALSMALAFGEFSKKLEGKPHRFQVDLRDTNELETELLSKSTGGAEYEA